MDTIPTKAAGLIYGPELHHLDHLGPLCSMMQIPLIITEEEIAIAANKYYPDLDVIFSDYLAVAQHLVQHFDIIFYSIARDIFDEVFFFSQKFSHKKVHTIWSPHGNSDKGNATFFMEALKKEKAALVYGQKMIDFMKKKKVFDQLKAYAVTGNYRYTYYKKHKSFYDQVTEQEIKRRLKKASKTFFAPTWQDYEKSSSFFDACPYLADQLPDDVNLIVKLHPNLLLQNNLKTEEVLWKYEDRDNILFLAQFPPVYPLLELADIYVGDMSSIGYDFLAFDKPMFFLNQNNRDVNTDPGLYLYQCGVEIKPERYKDIYRIIDDHLKFELREYSSIRKKIYDYTFGNEKSWDELRKEIEEIYPVFSKDDLEFL